MEKRELVRKLIPRLLRNWLRSPVGSARYLMDRIAFRCGVLPSVRLRDDWVIQSHPAARERFELFRNDWVQADELEAFVQHCPDGIRLVDIGAHYGFFTLAALHYGGPSAEVVSVEASPAAANILLSNLRINHCQGRVRVLNVAMGANDGYLPMLTTGPLGADYFVMPTESRVDTVLVPQRNLKSLVTELDFQPSHIKLDIEGFEHDVITSSIEWLAKCRPVVFLELHGDALRARGIDPAGVMAALHSAGYTRFLLGRRESHHRDLEQQHYNCRIVCLAG